MYIIAILGGRRVRGLQPHFQISKTKENNKTKQQKKEDNPLEKKKERERVARLPSFYVYTH